MAPGRTALLGVADVALGERLAREVERFANQAAVTVVSHLSQLRERLRESAPRAILLDEAILQGAPLIELLRQLTETAPVILLGAFEHRADISRLVAEATWSSSRAPGTLSRSPQASSNAGCAGPSVRNLRSGRRGRVCPPTAPKSCATKSITRLPASSVTPSWCWRTATACLLQTRSASRPSLTSPSGFVKPRAA
jgi:hypothetical protein